MSQSQAAETRSGYPAGPMILVEEISHRVVNEYAQAIACMQIAAGRLASAEARQALMAASLTLRNFADAHRALQVPRAAGSVDLGDYLARLCAATMAAGLNERGVRLQLSCDAIHMSSERCWRVALIVAELVTNSVRHGLEGGAGQVVVDLADEGENVRCSVSDNGVAKPDIQPARGLSVVKGLAEGLNGDVRWRFGPAGTTATLTFPKLTQRDA